MKPSDLPDIVVLARTLNRHRVKWVLIGGMALILHGGNHSTIDCDVAFEKSRDNLESLQAALEELGARPKRAPEEGEFELDFSILLGPFMHLKSLAGDIDLINRLPGIEKFDDLYQRSELIDIGGESIRIASIDDMIRLKENSTRARDREHVFELRALKKLAEET
jgi:hypothetical protein